MNATSSKISRTVFAAGGLLTCVAIAWVFSSAPDRRVPTALLQPIEVPKTTAEVGSVEARGIRRTGMAAEPGFDEPHSPRRNAGERALPASPRGTILLRAIDDQKGREIRDFAWALDPTDAGGPSSGSARGGAAIVRVPLRVPMMLRVRAEGYAPSLAVDVSLHRGRTTRSVTVRLVPKDNNAGLLLSVRDNVGRAVSHVRVSCSRSIDGRRGWRMDWSEVSTARDGEHRFDGVAAGRLRLRVVALRKDGRPRLLLPVERATRWNGLQTRRLEIALAEPAGTIELQLTSTSDVDDVRVVRPTGVALPVRWIESGQGGVRELNEPIEPGSYFLQWGTADGRTAPRVAVVAGQRVRVRMR